MLDVGFGTWHISNDIAESIVLMALKNGYRHIDTASKYNNEEAIGKAIINSGINRKEIFVTSKLWNTNKGYQNTLDAFYETLNKLNVNYIDEYLIHWPIIEDSVHSWEQVNADTWRAMEYLYEQGKIKRIRRQ